MSGEGAVNEVPEWVGYLGLPLAWPLLVLATGICFWSLSAVCEERFVPALTVICEKGKIPDDVAGATMMSAGASAPEVFASLIALFITHSSLGVGTVVGSEIFNHLIICAGSVLCAKGGVLRLDRKIVLRESGFYLLALIFLLVILTHERSPQHTIVIRLWAPLVLVATYVSYVLVCVYYDRVLALLGVAPRVVKEAPSHKWRRRASSSLIEEPAENFAEQDDDPLPPSPQRGDYQAVGGDLLIETGIVRTPPSARRLKRGSLDTRGSFLDRRISNLAIETVGELSSWFHKIVGMPPSELELEHTKRESDTFGCYLYKANHFYTGHSVTSAKAWEVRWIEIASEGVVFTMRHSRENEADHLKKYRLSSVYVVDERKRLLQCDLEQPDGAHGHTATFLAPSRVVFDALLDYTSRAVPKLAVPAEKGEEEDDDDDCEQESFTAWPEGSNYISLGGLWHVTVFPLKCALQWTLFDVRTPKATMAVALRCVAGCVLWLAVLSLAMCYCCETIGSLLGLSDAIVGITFSAVGTSLPNLVSSMVVSQKGLGNMAVSNALGSNTFNILVGLGVPWAIYCSTIGVYDTLPAEDVLTPVIILVFTLAVFLGILFLNDFCLHQRHGYAFIAGYIAFLAYAIASTFK